MRLDEPGAFDQVYAVGAGHNAIAEIRRFRVKLGHSLAEAVYARGESRRTAHEARHIPRSVYGKQRRRTHLRIVLLRNHVEARSLGVCGDIGRIGAEKQVCAVRLKGSDKLKLLLKQPLHLLKLPCHDAVGGLDLEAVEVRVVMVVHLVVGDLELGKTLRLVGDVLYVPHRHAVRQGYGVGVLVVIAPERLVVELGSRLRLVRKPDNPHGELVGDIVYRRVKLHRGDEAGCIHHHHAELHQGDAALLGRFEQFRREAIVAQDALVCGHVESATLPRKLTENALLHLVVRRDDP